MDITEAREIECTKCGKKEKEKFFGFGFPGWSRICEVVTEKIVTKKVMIDKVLRSVAEKVQIHPELCPDCMKELCVWIEDKKR